jgi:hypothetical protein
MADYYVKNGGDGSTPTTDPNGVGEGNPGWGGAYDNIGAALAAVPAGNTIKVSVLHRKTYGATETWTSNATWASKIPVISVSDTDVNTYARGALEDLDAGSYDLSLTADDFFMFFGMNFNIGDDIIVGTGTSLFLDDCVLFFAGSAGVIDINTASLVYMFNTDITFDNTGTGVGFNMAADGAVLYWEGGTLTGNITELINVLSGQGGKGRFIGLDLSAMSGASKYLIHNVADDSFETHDVKFYRCKFGATPPALLKSTTFTYGSYGGSNFPARAIECHSGSTPYFILRNARGYVEHDSSTYRSGADPLSNNFSAKMVTTAEAEFFAPLEYKIGTVWAAQDSTITVEITHNDQGAGTGNMFTNKECWLKVLASDDTAKSLGNWDYSTRGPILGSASDQGTDNGTSTWGAQSEGLDQSISVTPNAEEGKYEVYICLAKSNLIAGSDYVYVCPQIDVS